MQLSKCVGDVDAHEDEVVLGVLAPHEVGLLEDAAEDGADVAWRGLRGISPIVDAQVQGLLLDRHAAWPSPGR